MEGKQQPTLADMVYTDAIKELSAKLADVQISCSTYKALYAKAQQELSELKNKESKGEDK